MNETETLPILTFASAREWEAWLDAHHGDAAGIWLKIAKKEAGIPSVSYADAVESALCYGWIDGKKVTYDAHYWLQKFTPRRARSIWSQVNRDKALALIAAGRMRPSGREQVERARRDGRWDAAYAPARTIEVPPEFQRELDAHPEAQAFFATLNRTNRYAILWRIHTAKKPETRAARIAQCIAMLARGETIHP